MNVYIDSENISPLTFNTVRNHYLNSKLKILSVKIFNDWSLTITEKWNKLCRMYSLEQIQCPKRKNSVDFSIIINIINDIHLDDLTIKKIKKILIISSDTDYICITNQVRQKGRDIEVFSPYYDNSMYRRQERIYVNDGYDIEKEIYSDEQNGLYSVYDVFHKSKNVEEYSSDDSNKEVIKKQNYKDTEKQVRRGITKTFRWINSNKRPFRRVKFEDFKIGYQRLVHLNVIKQNINWSEEIHNYSDCIILIEDNDVQYIDFVGNEQIYKKYHTFSVKSVLDDMITVFNYNNTQTNDSIPCLKISSLFENMYLLLQKNMLHTKREHLTEIIRSKDSFKKYFDENKELHDHFFIERDCVFNRLK